MFESAVWWDVRGPKGGLMGSAQLQGCPVVWGHYKDEGQWGNGEGHRNKGKSQWGLTAFEGSFLCLTNSGDASQGLHTPKRKSGCVQMEKAMPEVPTQQGQLRHQDSRGHAQCPSWLVFCEPINNVFHSFIKYVSRQPSLLNPSFLECLNLEKLL